VLVTGASGLLGAHVVTALAGTHDVTGVDRHPWWGESVGRHLTGDLADEGFLADSVSRSSPEVVVHCAAMINVDACEEHPALAYAANAGLTDRLARAVSPSCLFVYVTTDGVFKGDVPFCTERDLPCPRTVYGRSKLHGEWNVQLATNNHLIIRTNFFGWSSGLKVSSAEWLYHALERRQSITLFDDFFFTPLYVVDFVTRLNLLIEGGHRGLFHLVGRDRVSKVEFGQLLAQAARFSMDSVSRGSIDDAPLKAPRPRDMSLRSERFERETGVALPSCKSGIERFVADHEVQLRSRIDPLALSKGMR
jgi:dTDP-4-dehydrorhamnose reductase